MRKIFTFLCAALMSVGMWAEPITVTWTRADILHKGSGNSFTKDGVTVTCGGIDWNYPDFSGNGTFTTDLGNFTKIEVTADLCDMSGDGWSGNDKQQTWTGNAASVSCTGDIYEISSIVFTIAEPSGGETAVDNIQIDKAQSTKLIRNGMLLIEKNGKIYNVMGAEVK